MVDAHHRVAGFLADFRTRAAAAGVRAEIVEELGDPAERILWEAHRADIVVLGRETHFKFQTPERRDATLAQVVRSCPRPMVVVPETLAEGSGILVAYGGGREAARTLQIFTLLGLVAGETLDVLTCTGIPVTRGRPLAPPAIFSRHTPSRTVCTRSRRPPRLHRSYCPRWRAGGLVCSSSGHIASIHCAISLQRR
jgi:hypothetical protein